MSVSSSPLIGVFCRREVRAKRDLLVTLATEIHHRQGWELVMVAPDNRGEPPAAPSGLAALVAWPDDYAECEMLAKLKLPTIWLGHMTHPVCKKGDRLMFDNVGIGAAIADVFLARGFRHFAALLERPDPRLGYSLARCKGFQDRLEKAGAAPPAILDATALSQSAQTWNHDLAELGKWLVALPKPCAVLCDRDSAGVHLLAACRHFAIPVPQEIAAIAVGNDELVCGMSRPPLSAVDILGGEAGKRTAVLLENRLKNPKAKPITETLHRFQVVERTSSEVLAVPDPRLAKALSILREKACDPLEIPNLARASGLSRRSLESLFREHLDTTPHAEILRVRLQKAQDFLLHTNLPVGEISHRCGFAEPQRFCEAFRRSLGTTPGAWRRGAKT